MDDGHIVTAIQLFQLDRGNEGRCIEFAEARLDLLMKLVDPVGFVPKVPKSPPDEDVEPS